MSTVLRPATGNFTFLFTFAGPFAWPAIVRCVCLFFLSLTIAFIPVKMYSKLLAVVYLGALVRAEASKFGVRIPSIPGGSFEARSLVGREIVHTPCADLGLPCYLPLSPVIH